LRELCDQATFLYSFKGEVMNLRKGIAKAALAASMVIGVSGVALLGAWARTQQRREEQSGLRSTIAFVSTRHDPAADPAVDPQRAWLAAEIYLMDGDGTNPRRITENTYSDGFPSLSPDGRRIVFDSNRLRAEGEPLNISGLFVMNADGTGQTSLVRGSSATWSPDGKSIAFHASASGTGKPINSLPGAATTDSDIFIMNVDDFLKNQLRPKNITNNPAAIDDDPDWSPRGRQIIFTSHAVTDNADNHVTAEIYMIDADGKGKPTRLTNNTEEERAPSWSPDGKRIVFCCRRGGPDLEICVMNADGTGQMQLTENTIGDLTPSWSPDGQKIVFHRRVGQVGQFQLFLINADGTGEKQLTVPPGLNAFPNWGEVRSRGPVK
jgi:Tol biopolymer transport system component